MTIDRALVVRGLGNMFDIVVLFYRHLYSEKELDILAFGALDKRALLTEPRHEISNNVVCATNKASDQPAHTRSLIRAFAIRLNSLSVKLLTEHHLEFLCLKGGCTGLSESTLVKCHIVGNLMSRLKQNKSM